MKTRLRMLLTIIVICAVVLSSAATAYASEEYGGEITAKDNVHILTWSLNSEGVLTVRGIGAIPDYAKGSRKPWSSCSNLIQALIIEDGITGIGDRAFQSCKNMKTANIAESVISIGEWAFQNCYALETVIMPQSGVEMKTGAFRSSGAELDVRANEMTSYLDSDYYLQLQSVRLTGNYREDIIEVAKTQISYHEGNSSSDYDGNNSDGNMNYTEYGRYLDSVGTVWCSEFASWCFRMAGVPTNVLENSRGANATAFTNNTSSSYYSWSETCFAGGSYTPQKADLILFAETDASFTPSDSLAHTAILNEVIDDGTETVTFKTVEGNSGDRVREYSYVIDKETGILSNRSGRLAAYIVSPNFDAVGISYPLLFNANGGTVPIESKQVAAGSIYGVLPLPCRSGFHFNGWYTAALDGKRINMGNVWRETTGQTLYAHWTLQEEMIPKNGYLLYDILPVDDHVAIGLVGNTCSSPYLISAAYDRYGSMIACAGVRIAPGYISEIVSIPLPTKTAFRIAAYLLDADASVPLCASVENRDLNALSGSE